MKIGVLADTHIPDRRRSLPPKVLESFARVEIVLHAGDITNMDVLRQLQDHVSLTFAVFGDRDPSPVRAFLQETHVLEFGSTRIGMIHGNRDGGTSLLDRLRAWSGRSPHTPELFDYLNSRFSGVDAIVFGHTHLPYAHMHGGVFFFNPGSLVPRKGQPTVGLLELDKRRISGRIVPL